MSQHGQHPTMFVGGCDQVELGEDFGNVLFTGGTLMVSLLGTILMGVKFFNGLAFGSSTAVLAASTSVSRCLTHGQQWYRKRDQQCESTEGEPLRMALHESRLQIFIGWC